MSVESAHRHQEAARGLWDNGKFAEAVPHIRRAIGAMPERSVDLEAWLVMALLQSGRPFDEEEGIRRSADLVEDQAAALSPEMRAQILSQRAWALSYHRGAQPDAIAEADATLTRASQWHPTGRPDANTLALVRLRQGRLPEAASLCAQVRSAMDSESWAPEKRAAAIALHGLTLAYLGETAAAQELMTSAAEAEPTTALLGELRSVLAGTGDQTGSLPGGPVGPGGPSAGPPGPSGSSATAMRFATEDRNWYPPSVTSFKYSVPATQQADAVSRGQTDPGTGPGSRTRGKARFRRGNSASGRFTFSDHGGFWATMTQMPVTCVLMAVNIGVYLLVGMENGSLANHWLLVPGYVHSGYWYTLFTSQFLHIQVWHIAVNMYSLWIMGRILEPAIGSPRFAGIYFLCGFGGSVSVYLFAAVDGGTLGASGAIFGLIGFLTVLLQRRGLPLQQVLAVLVLNLVITFVVPDISWQGHMGGLAIGLVTGVGHEAFRLLPSARRLLLEVSGAAVLVAAMTAAVVVVNRTLVVNFFPGSAMAAARGLGVALVPMTMLVSSVRCKDLGGDHEAPVSRESLTCLERLLLEETAETPIG